MTVSSSTSRIAYAGNGATAAFAIPFYFLADGDITVSLRSSAGVDTVQTLTTNYSLSGAGVLAGGTCTMVTAPPVGSTLSIYRTPTILQATDYTPNDRFPAETHERGLDLLTMIAQMLQDRVSRSVRAPDADLNPAMALPPSVDRANKYLGFASNGDVSLVTALTGVTPLTNDIIGQLVWPRTAREISLGITPSKYYHQPGDPRRYGADPTGVTNSTTAINNAIAVAAGTQGDAVDWPAGDFLVNTIKLDVVSLHIRASRGATRLIADTGIPAGGAIVLSMAGGADAVGNQAILDAIYGAGVQTVRTVVPNSLEDVILDGITFVPNANAIKAVWMTGFTRGCAIRNCSGEGFDDHGIALNGSWGFTLEGNRFEGDGTNGTGIGLGQGGGTYGTRGGSAVVNAAKVSGNHCSAHANGMLWLFGAGGEVTGNTFELNATDGLRMQSTDGVLISGNYLEQNAGDNLQTGGTNGTDFCTGLVIEGNHFNNTVAVGGNNHRLQGMVRCRVGKNNFSGDKTQHYFIAAATGQYITDCDIEVPDITSTYISNSTELDAGTNLVRKPNGKKFTNTENGNYTFTVADPARIIYKASGGAGETWTIPANATVAFPIGTVLEGVNRGGGTLSVAITTDTLQLAGGTTTGTRTVADGGWFRVTKIDTTVWLIEGLGVT